MGSAYCQADFTTWKLEETLSPCAAKVLRDATLTEGWCVTIPWYENVQGFMGELFELGDVRILTAAVGDSDHWINERKAGLQGTFGFDQNEIIFCPGPEKQFVFGDILIEDRLDTCVQWAARWSVQTKFLNSKAILIDRPWNQGNTPFGVYRVSSYNEALELIRT